MLADFPLPTLGPTLRALLRQVTHGRGFQLISGVPVERWPQHRSVLAYWWVGGRGRVPHRSALQPAGWPATQRPRPAPPTPTPRLLRRRSVQGHGALLGSCQAHQQAGPPAGPHQGAFTSSQQACRSRPLSSGARAPPCRRRRCLALAANQPHGALAHLLCCPSSPLGPTLQDIGLDPARPETRLYATSAPQVRRRCPALLQQGVSPACSVPFRDPRVSLQPPLRPLPSQPIHNDGPADVVTLLCLSPAAQGGASTWSSSHAVYNEVLRRRPDLLPVLASDTWAFDRKGEVPPGKQPYFLVPVFK